MKYKHLAPIFALCIAATLNTAPVYASENMPESPAAQDTETDPESMDTPAEEGSESRMGQHDQGSHKQRLVQHRTAQVHPLCRLQRIGFDDPGDFRQDDRIKRREMGDGTRQTVAADPYITLPGKQTARPSDIG